MFSVNLLFLRFICPIVVKPLDYKLVDAPLSPEKTQDLIMVAKVLQTMANFTKFGSKEEAMVGLNPFLEKNVLKMRSYFLNFIDVVRPPIQFSAFVFFFPIQFSTLSLFVIDFFTHLSSLF